ncbi:shikimate dehydrogenase [Candidatus Electrothrix sp.]|uniref:shikimate dehydrogenase n=1 Tax=Candidatus Electrothrix sp. TaxID=2170559 RepID=UPI004055C5EE
MAIDGKTELYGIIGNPVRHSLSPVMHNAGFADLAMNRAYVPLEVKNIKEGLTGLRALGFRGVSVTVPHKEAVIPFLDDIDPVAEKIGAVNTLVFQPRQGGQVHVHGLNTDWLGANTALAEKVSLAGSRILVIGAGGSAKAVGFGLIEAGAEVIIANRTAESGKALADLLGCTFIPLAEVTNVSADVLINTTSVGMEPDNEGIAVPPSLLPGFSVVMDIVYAPLETRLLREARAAGCQTIDGLAMLLYQGIAQFETWTGKKAPQDVMRLALEEELQRRAA